MLVLRRKKKGGINLERTGGTRQGKGVLFSNMNMSILAMTTIAQSRWIEMDGEDEKG
jgi:hypothetical protein